MSLQVAPVLALSTTALLAAIFALPIGSEARRRATAESLAGRTLAFTPPPPAPAAATAHAVEAPAPKTPPPAEIRPLKTNGGYAASGRHRRNRPPVVHAPAPTPAVSVAASSSTAAAQPAPAADAAPARPNLQELLDRFEADPSRYPLDRQVRKDGVTLALEGLARIDRFYVLKVTVTNETDADFFAKDFTIRAGSLQVSSRSVFRILVEPQRARTGYVVFEKPQPGAAVHVALKEDGGKGRTIDSAVPYPF